MDIPNESVVEVTIGIPEGHRHLRARILLRDGTELVLREATIANLARAYISVKTDPVKASLRLTGKKLEERKPGFAEWQLIEER